MPFFQNVFDNDFITTLLIDDAVNFKVPANVNKGVYHFAWANPPYNTVGNTSLTINYSIDAGMKYFPLVLTLSSGATKTSDDLVADLNGNTNFTPFFEAKVIVDNTGVRRLLIQARRSRENFRFYISNTSAETVLRFNSKAGIAELPTYFERHTIDNFKLYGPGGTNVYPDSQGNLIKLTQPTDDWYISNAGLSTTAKADWELLRGKSNEFMFQKITVDGSNRITQIIKYTAGSLAGDLSKKTTYTYTAANTNPDKITEVPYVLTSGDLVTP